MKLLATIVSLAAVVLAGPADECPHNLQVLCIDDINKAYPICEKAAHEKGKDFPADLDCMKYMSRMDKDCWPCICMVAHQLQWTVKGC